MNTESFYLNKVTRINQLIFENCREMKRNKYKRNKYLSSQRKGLSCVFVILLGFIVYYFKENYEIRLKSVEIDPPKYWLYQSYNNSWIFSSVENVLKRMGVEKIEMNVDENELFHMEWNLLWTYDYHGQLPIDFSKLLYHQKINHIPGNYVIVTKDILSICANSKYIPKAFNESDKLLEYAAKYPEKKFVQKFHSNRGVLLKNASDIIFDISAKSALFRYFAQEFVEDPLLFEGHKFDFGVYVVITSVNPLRIHYYTKNILLRFCRLPYDPNNFENVDSYVISNVCLFSWDFPKLQMYNNHTYTYKEAFSLYLTKKGYNMSVVWFQVEDCIRTIVLANEHHFIEAVRNEFNFLLNIQFTLICFNFRSKTTIQSLISLSCFDLILCWMTN